MNEDQNPQVNSQADNQTSNQSPIPPANPTTPPTAEPLPPVLPAVEPVLPPINSDVTTTETESMTEATEVVSTEVSPTSAPEPEPAPVVEPVTSYVPPTEMTSPEASPLATEAVETSVPVVDQMPTVEPALETAPVVNPAPESTPVTEPAPVVEPIPAVQPEADVTLTNDQAPSQSIENVTENPSPQAPTAVPVAEVVATVAGGMPTDIPNSGAVNGVDQTLPNTSPPPAIPEKDGASQFAPPPTVAPKKSMLPILLIILGVIIVAGVAFFFYNRYQTEQTRIEAEQMAEVAEQARLQKEAEEQSRMQAEAEEAIQAKLELETNKKTTLTDLHEILASSSALVSVLPETLGTNNYFGYDEYYCSLEDNYFPYLVQSELIVGETADMTEADLAQEKVALESSLQTAGFVPQTLEFCSSATPTATDCADLAIDGEASNCTTTPEVKMLSFFERDTIKVAVFVNPADGEGTYSDPVVSGSDSSAPTLEVQIFSDLEDQVSAQQPFTTSADYSKLTTDTNIELLPLSNRRSSTLPNVADTTTANVTVYRGAYDGVTYEVEMEKTDDIWTAMNVIEETLAEAY